MNAVFRFPKTSSILVALTLGGCSVYEPTSEGPASYGTSADGDGGDVDPSNGSASEGDGSSAGDGAGACATEEGMLAGTWVTPEDAVVEPGGFYATLELDPSDHTGQVVQHASGASQTTGIVQWRMEGDCDELHWDYGTGWLPDYSNVIELTATALELEATDGSYYGMRSRYRKEGGGGSETGCGGPCSAGCDAGSTCQNTDAGELCLPPDCAICFSDGLECNVDLGACAVIECTGDGPSTCGLACEPDMSTCGAGQDCVDTEAGFNCLPPECADCIAMGVLCDYDATCGFRGCL